MIDVSVDPRRSLTTYTVRGRVSTAAVAQAIAEFYDSGPTRRVLWDFTGAILDRVPRSDIESLATEVAERGRHDPRRRTALVFAVDVAYGFGRMFETYAELAESRQALGIFRDMAEALGWLLGEER